jgi:hypothetical protein
MRGRRNKMNYIIKIMISIMIAIFITTFSVDPTYAGPKGKGKAKGKGVHKENIHSNAQAAAHKSEKRVNQAKLRANLPKGKGHSKVNNAKWFHNPKDERGQGNMGKPMMRDPYGHDKDSGREKAERGRPIKEPEQLSLDGLINVDFSSLGEYQSGSLMNSFLGTIEYYKNNWSGSLLSRYLTYEQFYQIMYDHVFPVADATGLLVNHRDSIDYNMSIDNWSGGTLLVTTTITSEQEYNSTISTYDYDTKTWQSEPVSYTSGEVIFEQTQEAAFDAENNTLNYSQDLPGDIMGTEQNYAFNVGLNVTVTDPQSGASYTTNYDKQLYLYRCPYGKVYDTDTGQSIVGAKVTVHFEDGSIVPLDKASNPTASNPQVTDATGRYGVKLQANRKYYITATAEGYKEYKSSVFTEKWHVLREDISLTPVDVVLGSK